MGRRTGGLLMASLSSLGAIVSFSHFVTGMLLQGNHIPVYTYTQSYPSGHRA